MRELQPLKSIKNAFPFRQTMVDYICSSSYFVVSLQSESYIYKTTSRFTSACKYKLNIINLKYLGATKTNSNCSVPAQIRKTDYTSFFEWTSIIWYWFLDCLTFWLVGHTTVHLFSFVCSFCDKFSSIIKFMELNFEEAQHDHTHKNCQRCQPSDPLHIVN